MNPMSARFNTQRLEMFSDAVMAVAITLMVLRIDPPTPGPGQTLGQAFWDDTRPLILYYLITFAVIVAFWIHHHDIFSMLPSTVTAGALWLNMAFLACICLLPFGLEFFSAGDPSYLTVGVYAGLMAVATLFLGAFTRATQGHWMPDTFIGAGVFLLAVPFAEILGGWALLLWGLDYPITRLLQRWRAPHRPAT